MNRTANFSYLGMPPSSRWPWVRLKYIGRLKGGAGFPDAEQGIQDEEIPFFKVKHLEEADSDGCLMKSEHSISRMTALKLGAFVFPTDTIVFAKVGAALLLNRFRYLSKASCIDNNMMGLVANQSLADRQFMLYSLSLIDFGDIANPGAVPSLNTEQVSEQLVPFPPLPAQRAIASFLDRETARLDALVAAKKRLLEILAEKRRALITQTVTRGLNTDAPMKDSGIPWLGKIPAHWNTPPIYARFQVQLGKMLDEKRIRGTHLAVYLRNVDVQWHAINISDLPEMDFDDEDRVQYSLRQGDILLCEGGEVGRCAIWDYHEVECYYQKALHRLRPFTGQDDPRFFTHMMFSFVQAGVLSYQTGSATILHLPAEKLRVLRYPSPPLAEQHAIVAHISAETAKLDALKACAERTIDLLKERRSALISAAVTGQIPVCLRPGDTHENRPIDS